MSVFFFRNNKDFAEKDLLVKIYKAQVGVILIIGQIIRIKARKKINIIMLISLLQLVPLSSTAP